MILEYEPAEEDIMQKGESVLEQILYEYKNAKNMARDIKMVIDCQNSKSFCSRIRKRPEDQDAEQFITGLFDIEENRLLIFREGKVIKIFHDTLFGSKRKGPSYKRLFLDALLAHDRAIYEPLLSDML